MSHGLIQQPGTGYLDDARRSLERATPEDKISAMVSYMRARLPEVPGVSPDEERYREDLPGRMIDLSELLSGLLPEGLTVDWRPQIGRGGTGTDECIPECPVCHAFGGGGHGGMCPNADRSQAEWTDQLPDGYSGPPELTS